MATGAIHAPTPTTSTPPCGHIHVRAEADSLTSGKEAVHRPEGRVTRGPLQEGSP